MRTLAKTLSLLHTRLWSSCQVRATYILVAISLAICSPQIKSLWLILYFNSVTIIMQTTNDFESKYSWGNLIFFLIWLRVPVFHGIIEFLNKNLMGIFVNTKGRVCVIQHLILFLKIHFAGVAAIIWMTPWDS